MPGRTLQLPDPHGFARSHALGSAPGLHAQSRLHGRLKVVQRPAASPIPPLAQTLPSAIASLLALILWLLNQIAVKVVIEGHYYGLGGGISLTKDGGNQWWVDLVESRDTVWIKKPILPPSCQDPPTDPPSWPKGENFFFLFFLARLSSFLSF